MRSTGPFKTISHHHAYIFIVCFNDVMQIGGKKWRSLCWQIFVAQPQPGDFLSYYPFVGSQKLSARPAIKHNVLLEGLWLPLCIPQLRLRIEFMNRFEISKEDERKKKREFREANLLRVFSFSFFFLHKSSTNSEFNTAMRTSKEA